MARTASIGIRVEPELKAAIDAAAKADNRTTAQWVELACKRALEAAGERGHLPKTGE